MLVTIWATRFDSNRVIFRPSRFIVGPQGALWDPQRCKRWGSHNAVNVCMSGSTP